MRLKSALSFWLRLTLVAGRRHLVVARPVDSAIVLRPNVLSKTPAGGAGIGAALAARERNAGAHLRGAVAEVVVTPAQVRKGVVVLPGRGRGRGQTVERVVAEAPRAVNRVGNIQDVARKVVAAAGVGTVLCLIRRVEVRAIPPFHDKTVKGWGTHNVLVYQGCATCPITHQAFRHANSLHPMSENPDMGHPLFVGRVRPGPPASGLKLFTSNAAELLAGTAS